MIEINDLHDKHQDLIIAPFFNTKALKKEKGAPYSALQNVVQSWSLEVTKSRLRRSHIHNGFVFKLLLNCYIEIAQCIIQARFQIS